MSVHVFFFFFFPNITPLHLGPVLLGWIISVITIYPLAAAHPLVLAMQTSSVHTYFGPREVPPPCLLILLLLLPSTPKLNIPCILHTWDCTDQDEPIRAWQPFHHADRLVRHWVGGVSLRICAHHCPAGLLLEWFFTALTGMGLFIPSHPHIHTHCVKKLRMETWSSCRPDFQLYWGEHWHHSAVAW